MIYVISFFIFASMLRMIIAIWLLFSAAAVVAHGILAYEVNAEQSLAAEDKADDQPGEKELKPAADDKIFSSQLLHQYHVSVQLRPVVVHNDLLYSSGFSRQLYMPPEAI